MTVGEYPVPPLDFFDEKKHRRLLAQTIAQMHQGKTGNVLDVTLTNNGTATTVSDARIAATTVVHFTPVHADSYAMSKLPLVVDAGRQNGFFVASHSAVASANLKFKAVLVG